MRKNDDTLVYVIAGACFLCCSYFVIANIKDNIVLLRHGVTARARIVDVLKKSRHRGPADYFPVIELQGKRLTGTRDTYFFGYEKGQTVPVRYLAERPEVFIIDEFHYTWGFLYSKLYSFFFYLGIWYALSHVREHARAR